MMVVNLDDAGYWNSPEQCLAADEIRSLIGKLAKVEAERDRFADMISESSNRWQDMLSALREAKEALVMNIVGTGGRTPAAHNAIATINKVLGEE